MKNGTCWLDDAGQPIQGHGGMMLKVEDTWYWYGENKDVSGYPAGSHSAGISCYSSTDLRTWHNEGVVLSPSDDPNSLLNPQMICERPKVIYNAKTGRYVLWFHNDMPDYTFAAAGVAVADAPTGPFTYIRSIQPNVRDCRDMTIVQEENGAAWLLHSGDWNKTMYLSRLTDDYCGVTGECYKLLVDQEREAPAIFRDHGRWYMITSGCTGWAPNRALYAISPRLTMGWKLIGDPCTGKDARKSFYAQSSFVLEVGEQRYLLMDHWKPEDLAHSGFSLLPIHVDGDDVEIPWTEEFNGL